MIFGGGRVLQLGPALRGHCSVKTEGPAKQIVLVRWLVANLAPRSPRARAAGGAEAAGTIFEKMEAL